MSNILLALLLVGMLVASLRSMAKRRSVPYIDEVIRSEVPHRGWGLLPWLLGFVILVFALRVVGG